METQAEDTLSNLSIHPDLLVEHIILDVLGPSLGGQKFPRGG